MDEFHDRFPVYHDVSAPGNHFRALARIPDETAAVEVNGSWTDRPHGGATAIRNVFRSTTRARRPEQQGTARMFECTRRIGSEQVIEAIGPYLEAETPREGGEPLPRAAASGRSD